MRKVKCTSPPHSGGSYGASEGNGGFARTALLAAVMAVGVVLWQHLVDGIAQRQSGALSDQAQYVLLNALLALPFALAAVSLANRLVARADSWRAHASYAAAVSLLFSVLVVPLAGLQAWVQTLVYTGADHALHEAALGAGPLGLFRYGLRYALLGEPVAFVLALLTVGAFLAPLGVRDRRRLSGSVRRAVHIAVAATTAIVMTGTTGSAAQAASGAAKPNAHGTVVTSTGGCASSTVPKRTYNVVAINVDIALDRTGDHDPFGFMYALSSKVPAIRAFEKATTGHNAEDGTVPTAPTGKVSTGLAEDPIQPLVLRARLGECVVINFANDLVHGARGGATPTGQELMKDAAGNPVTPAVSIDPQGLAYDINDGGSSVGENPTSRMTAPGATNTYRFYLDPLAGEGGKVFHSGGDARELTAHGLFGAIIAEPAGSRWFDTETGTDHTADSNWNSWQAMIQPGSGKAFREFAIMYHEVGDENFNPRRPVNDPLVPPSPTGDHLGAPGPMVDSGIPSDTNKDPGATDSYRPGSRAMNYRSEPFWRRLQEVDNIAHPTVTGPDLPAMVKDKKALGYSTYTFGDPATPMPQSYLGEPTKTRLMHPGSEQLHVHHLHGGGDRWPANPRALDPNAFATGLKKDNFLPQNTIQLDSQTVGPDESYNLEHACGAGGCQQGAGDYLFHCHIAQHYIAGMWSFWRVFDTRQPNVAPLPGATAPAAGVTSDKLVGKTFEGKTIVLSNPGPGQVSLKDWVEGQLPPQGVRTGGVDPNRPGDDDATVWDWALGGTPTAPVYLTEPEDTLSWADYTPPHPGTRDPILFDPVNGRYAWPLTQPHLADRPPFSPNGHGGAPWLGNNASTARPDGLCPAGAPVNHFNVVAISVAVQETPKETDPNGRFFVLAEDKDAVKNGTKAAEPLAIRSNVGDCDEVTLTSELDPTQQTKVNMHTHFVQFDPQASDGVITGASYEQSVGNDAGIGNTTLTQAAGVGDTVLHVAGTDFLRTHTGVGIAVGEGRADIEVGKVASFDPAADTVTLAAPLTKAHVSGEPTGTEFVQYRWYDDVDSGTVFWHDHVDGITSWAHGLFGAHIIEPAGSVYLDPSDHSKQIRSGTQADIVTTGSVGFNQQGSFREFMMFLSNGRRGRPELNGPPPGSNQQSLVPLDFGQECEEGNINMRAEPLAERVPRADTVDDRTSPTGTAWDGATCRNDYLDPVTGELKSTPQTIPTTDPNVFSSVKYGDPKTPLLRAYAGDPVVIRTIGTNERVEALRIQGHRFRRERFNGDGELEDAGTTGISERFDYVLDGGAGGPKHIPGDYLYYSTRNFALESGAWGIFRVFDKLQPTLAPLPDRAAPPSGQGFPRQTVTGQNPAPPGAGDSTINPCPSGAPTRSYDVSIFNVTLQSAPANATGPLPADDSGGVIYALTSDVAGIKAGTKPLQPLVLRADIGDCVKVTLHNQITSGSAYGGTRAGFELAKLLSNPQQSGGAAVGFNPDTTVAIGGQRTYTFYADTQLGTSIFQDLGSEAAMLHGAYGELITEPKGSFWLDNETGAFLGPNATSTAAAVIVPFGKSFREFSVMMSTTDQHVGRSIIPYWDTVAGTSEVSTAGLAPENDDDDGNPVTINGAPVVPGLVKGQQPGFSVLNYHSAPIPERIGSAVSSSPGDGSRDYGNAYNDTHGKPETPLFRSFPGDPVVFRVAIGASNEFHTFAVEGHEFPWEPYMWDDATDHRSQLLTARAMASGETMDAELVGGAGGTTHSVGDFMYGDGRQQLNRAGLWGILRVLPNPFAGGGNPADPGPVSLS